MHALTKTAHHLSWQLLRHPCLRMVLAASPLMMTGTSKSIDDDYDQPLMVGLVDSL